VHLAYLDDAGTDKRSSIVMFGAVIVFPDSFGYVEHLHNIAVEQILPADQVDEKFQEFHATELFHGEGPFEGIEETKRFDAIRVLISAVQGENLPYIYAAIDRTKLKESPMGSANPTDVAFRLCALGIEDWARSLHPSHPGTINLDVKNLCLFIIDDTKDAQLKNQLRSSYRSLRAAHPYIPHHKQRLWHAHDDLFFSNSRDSVGVQIADLCNYFMWRNLLKKEGGEEFYEMFAKQAICAKPEPEWSTYRNLFRTHEDDTLEK
jgi:hypothetical protein